MVKRYYVHALVLKEWAIHERWKGVRGWIRRHILRQKPTRPNGIKITIGGVELPTIDLSLGELPMFIAIVPPIEISSRELIVRPVPEDIDIMPGKIRIIFSETDDGVNIS